MTIASERRKELVEEIQARIPGFISFHTGRRPDIYWSGEVEQERTVKFLGLFPVRRTVLVDGEFAGWLIPGFEPDWAWVLEDGSLCATITWTYTSRGKVISTREEEARLGVDDEMFSIQNLENIVKGLQSAPSA